MTQRDTWIGERAFFKCHARTAWAAMVIVCLAIVLGCSHATERRAIEGTVTLDGKPLETGSITFMPQPGTKSPTAGGSISQGRFSVSPAGGVFAGKFRVEITASRKTGRQVESPRSGGMVDETVPLIPTQYNRDSKLTAEITAQGANHFEFALQAN
jgi:hypothetical protein